MTVNENYAPVGSLVKNAYWGYVYLVLEHCDNGEVKIMQIPHAQDRTRDYDKHVDFDVWTHRTPMDRRDTLLTTHEQTFTISKLLAAAMRQRLPPLSSSTRPMPGRRSFGG